MPHATLDPIKIAQCDLDHPCQPSCEVGVADIDRRVRYTVTALLSNLVSNVPAVLVLKPFVANLDDPTRAWLVVAMASTVAGNLTLVGSVANLIVTQRARRYGVMVGFWAYLKVGAPLTVLTILFGGWWLRSAAG